MPTDEQYREEARNQVDRNSCVIPDSAKVDRYPGGAWVRAWINVKDSDIKDPNDGGQFGVGA